MRIYLFKKQIEPIGDSPHGATRRWGPGFYQDVDHERAALWIDERVAVAVTAQEQRDGVVPDLPAIEPDPEDVPEDEKDEASDGPAIDLVDEETEDENDG